MEIRLTKETGNFIRGLDIRVQAKIEQRLILLEMFGHRIRMPHSRCILPGIFELRMVGKDNIRLIYTFDHGEAIVFHAFVKKTEEISGYEMGIIRQKYNRLHL